MIRSNEIDLGENMSFMKQCGEVLDVRNRIAIRDSDMVQGSVVTAVTGGILGYHM